MARELGQGNFINGSFINEGTITLTSKNPSCNFDPVYSVKTDFSHVELAIRAARFAYRSWNQLKPSLRIEALSKLKAAFIEHETMMADAICDEMGKMYSEALTEAKSLASRIDLIIEHGLKRVATESIYDLRAETRYHSQGVLAVIGPYNFPAHLVNAHVIPSILLGNTVVIKPSEVCPKVGSIYASAVFSAGLPNGVVNIVHGDGTIGRALATHEDVDGVLFTGSYPTGRALKEALLDQPHKILALEMGGRNFAVVMDDANIKQALLEITLGAFLTTGQRCTATSRVLVHDKVFHDFKKHLLSLVSSLKPSSPRDNGLFGPLATKGALDHFCRGLLNAKSENVKVLIESHVLPGGAFVTPSVYQIDHCHPIKAYLGEELFGPNLCIERFSDLDSAIARINESPYGLSNAIFTLDPKNSECIINETKSGVLNINRSTNNACGQMPFGGLKKSGNQRPAGIDAVRYATFPMAITSLAFGDSQAQKSLKEKLRDCVDPISLSALKDRHDIEAILEIFGIFSSAAGLDRLSYECSSFTAKFSNIIFRELKKIFGDAVDVGSQFITFYAKELQDGWREHFKNLLNEISHGVVSLEREKFAAINVPRHLALPKSRTMLDRLYRDNFVPRDKKALVVNVEESRGAFLASIDDDPLVLIDAASQIATVGAGFLADTFQNAYDANELDYALVENCDLSLNNNEESASFTDASAAKTAFSDYIFAKASGPFVSIAFGASGAEANEIAFDLARCNGPGGHRIIAFEGAFHGRTIMALQATYNKEKRGPFVFKGYEAEFIPFPELKTPHDQPFVDDKYLQALSRGEIPNFKAPDQLLTDELNSLTLLKTEIEKGEVCAVIIEPMQCEGGDRYASNRFFSGLRALTKAYKIPLIFDEVQTGFNLGREFFWYQQLDLRDEVGQKVWPDVVTMAKKAQLGVCLSIWPNKRNYEPHVIQLKRGLLHAQAIDARKARALEDNAMTELLRLKEYFPELVLYPRACGFAFAFDMPTKELANQLIDQRFLRGFMAYIAGEKTLRFRLNMATGNDIIHRLFERLFTALMDIRDETLTERVSTHKEPDKTVVDDIEFISLTTKNFYEFEPQIKAIEEATYEPGRRDSMAALSTWLTHEGSVGIIMTKRSNPKEVLGYAIGGPLEYASVDGPMVDPHRDQRNTFYSANITIFERFRGLGLGSALKNEQIRRVYAIKNPDNHPRYLFLTGRNRVGLASAMTRINDNLKAYTIKIYDHQYGEENAKAAYYRLPLIKTKHPLRTREARTFLDCRNSLHSPFMTPPSSFIEAIKDNRLRSMVGSKLTLSNWATPNMVRYSELLRAVMPKHLTHAYFTSGRDEVIDKGIRSLRFHRLDADIAIGFSHQWLGTITAAARSLSHDEGQTQPFSFFPWPKIPHPGLVGKDASLVLVKKAISQHGSEKILGIFVELVGEKSALVFDEDYLKDLDAIRKDSGVPLVFIENASSLGRSGNGAFFSDSLSVKANMVLFYTGGQLGHIFVDDNYFVEKPLTLISTWDGDEISMTRAYHNLLHAAKNPWQKNIETFHNAMKDLPNKFERVGLGVWHAIRLMNKALLMKAIYEGRKANILFGEGFDSSLMIAAKADYTSEQFSQIIDVLKRIL